MSELPSLILARLFRHFLEALCGLLPLAPVLYLYFFQDPELRLVNHSLHEVAIFVALLEGLLISYISWSCYVRSGEVLVKWMTLGFIGFTVVYSLHGLFTPLADHNLWLFLLYGPASRLLLSFCLLMALLKSGGEVVPLEDRENPRYWMVWFAICLGINIFVALLAYSDFVNQPWVRLGQELGSIALCLTTLTLIVWRRFRSPLMLNYSVALVWFSISAIAFMLAQPWNHLWWLAHGIFAGGFSILGYGSLRSYLTTQSFDRVFDENELYEDMAETNGRLTQIMERLSHTNQQLALQVQASEIARQQFASLFSASPDGIIVVEEGGRIVSVNPRAADMFAYSEEKLVGLSVEHLIPPALREAHIQKRKLYEYSPVTRPMGSVDAPIQCLRSDGTIFPACIRLSSLVFEGRQCAVTFIRDLTQELAAEAKHREEDRQEIERGHFLERVVDLAPGMVFQFRRHADGSYEIPFASHKSLQILELSDEELMREGSRLLFSRVYPADLPPLITVIEQAAVNANAWRISWRVALPERGVLPYSIQMESPQLQADGALLWTGFIRCMQERKTDTK
ncbi:MAG: hypothetical protein RIR18_51 [Pseudomonadota bacterium]|jgi:PAS domain S-box-containing protein